MAWACAESDFFKDLPLKPIIAIFIGAGLCALLRWWLGLTLNSYFLSIPPGTLAANLIGGYIIGLAVAFFASFPGLAILERLRRDRASSGWLCCDDICGYWNDRMGQKLT